MALVYKSDVWINVTQVLKIVLSNSSIKSDSHMYINRSTEIKELNKPG